MTVKVSMCQDSAVEEERVWFEGGMQQLIKEAGGAIFRLTLSPAVQWLFGSKLRYSNKWKYVKDY